MGVPVGDSTPGAKAVERQWREYAEIYVRNPKSAETPVVLQELNGWLADNTYLAGTSLTSADRLVFDLLSEQMASLSHSDKEAVVHLSRWYNTLQMSTSPSKRRVTFSRTLLFRQ